MTIVAFGATTDIWNVSIYIHIMDINTSAPHLSNRKWGFEMLISGMTGSVLGYSVPHKNKMSCLFLSLNTYLSNMVSTTQKLVDIKSQEFIGLIKQHFITTSPLTCY